MGKRRFSAEEKLQTLEGGRAPGASIAEVCRRHQISTTLFYLWEKQAKQGKSRGRPRPLTGIYKREFRSLPDSRLHRF